VEGPTIKRELFIYNIHRKENGEVYTFLGVFPDPPALLLGRQDPLGGRGT
jgi:hypothetical protein